MLSTWAIFSVSLNLWRQFLIRILLLHLYEYQHDFIGPANCFCCLWKGWKIFTHSLGRLFHTSELCLVGKGAAVLAKDSEVQSQPWSLGNSGLLWLTPTYLWHSHTQALPKNLASWWACLDAWLREKTGTAQSSLWQGNIYLCTRSLTAVPLHCPRNICRDKITKYLQYVVVILIFWC